VLARKDIATILVPIEIDFFLFLFTAWVTGVRKTWNIGVLRPCTAFSIFSEGENNATLAGVDSNPSKDVLIEDDMLLGAR